jgi:RNase P/RNase MRP subunit POP5
MPKRRRSDERSALLVRSLPIIEDPKELYTILLFSLRDLWGELESHSSNVIVEKYQQYRYKTIFEQLGFTEPPEETLLFVVSCRSESVKEIRASLTLVTAPPYLSDISYRFDVLDVHDEPSPL